MKIVYFFKSNMMFSISLLAAVITSLFVPPGREYLSYFDFRTLVCLFCVLAVVSALKSAGVFYYAANRIINGLSDMRQCTIALVYITFLGSMLITNDMALLTFLPLSYLMLSSAGQQRHLAYVFILQNAAANLGGMLTPFGNPQNLFIYTEYNVDALEFMGIMLPPFIVSIVLLTLCCLVIEPEPLRTVPTPKAPAKKKTAICIMLLAVCIAAVFRLIPYIIALILIPAVLLITDRSSLREVDYPLIGTFAAFFIFAGNMAQIEVVRRFFSSVLPADVMLVSAALSQIISNVPSAVLLSRFTGNYRELLLGVNIGGMGTLIASLAGLITFRQFLRHRPEKAGSFIGLFSAVGFGFLFVLLAFEYFL